MIQHIHSNLPRIQIVSFDEIDAARDAGASRLARGPGKYERWEHLHDKIESVLREYGSVSSETVPLPDFYVSGDWFHENTDGFSVCSCKPLSKELLLKLQDVLSGHHRHAMLGMYGIENPIEGLVIHVTPRESLVGWQDLTADECRKRLQEVGVPLW
jgi:hypothetical protein